MCFLVFLRIYYTDILFTGSTKSTSLAPIDEHGANRTDQKPIPHRVSTKSSGLTVNSEDPLDDLESEEDDVFAESFTSKSSKDNVQIPSSEVLEGLELTESQVWACTSINNDN